MCFRLDQDNRELHLKLQNVHLLIATVDETKYKQPQDPGTRGGRQRKDVPLNPLASDGCQTYTQDEEGQACQHAHKQLLEKKNSPGRFFFLNIFIRGA